MSEHARIRLIVLLSCLLLATVACTRIPGPVELAKRSESVAERIEAHAADIESNGFESSRAALDQTLRAIRNEYGERSTEVPQAYSDAALMVRQVSGASDAIEYARDWLEACRVSYGPEHRETAYALHDLARMHVLAAPDHYAPEATALYREALDVRRRVLGPEHPETAGSEDSVVEQLIAICTVNRACPADDPLLTEAVMLNEHSLGVFDSDPVKYAFDISLGRQNRQKLRELRQVSADEASRHSGVPGSSLPTH